MSNELNLSAEAQFGKVVIDLANSSTESMALYEMEAIEMKGNAEAAVILGQHYRQSNVEEARKHFEIAAERDNAEGYWGMSLIVPHNETIDLNNPLDKEWFEYVKKAAQKGCADAKYQLGMLYGQMNYMTPAVYWLMMVSFFDRPDANYYLGELIGSWVSKGRPAEPIDAQDELDLLQQRTAKTVLSLMSDQEDADYLGDLTRLAKLGEPLAALMVGQIYEESRKMSDAADFYDLAIQVGDVQGMRLYADMLMIGNGIEKNEGQAISLYKEAALNGDRSSMFTMGQYENYEYNDPNMAAYWYAMAASRGYEAARAKINELAKKANL